jgi:hypothetical protein
MPGVEGRPGDSTTTPCAASLEVTHELQMGGTLIEQGIEIRTPDGISDRALYRSEDGRRLPGVIFLTDIGGVRPSQHEMARHLAREKDYLACDLEDST